MTPSTRVKLSCSACGLVVIALCLLAIRMANQSLAAAGAIRLACPDGDYAWATNDVIISFITQKIDVPNRYDKTTVDHVFNVTAKQTNLASHTTTSLSDFKCQLTEDYSNETVNWKFSHDGKRLLYGPNEFTPIYGDGAIPLSVWTTATDDVETVDDDVYAGIDYTVESVLWMPDDRRLLIAKDESGRKAALYNSESPDDSTVAIPLASSTPLSLGVTAENRLVYADVAMPHASPISIYCQDIPGSQSTPRKFTPKLPDGDTVQEISLSPRGDRLAWAISSIHTPPGYHIIKKIAPRFAARFAPHPVISIFVSQLDGSRMRFLGMEDSPPNQTNEMIRNLRWRPNGKWLSYRWHAGVYIVPAE